eukprot:TRINITY_DN1638_c0_g1_i1.p1 TRINITY_DN1638_c0_g1~~TRINITY_DN1638_c0_g1_i1.p1  ORF type:complete len:442 (-),score=115.36 TRINITY_DN1638_c0_g1_i1:29-1354(-)
MGAVESLPTQERRQELEESNRKIGKYKVILKEKVSPAMPSTLGDFKERELIEEIDIDEDYSGIDQILEKKLVSLHCLSLTEWSFVFVELDEDRKIYEQPFIYSEQYKYAESLYLVPIEHVLKWFERKEEKQNSLMNEENNNDDVRIEEPYCSGADVNFILSTGRCGSTLITKSFSKFPGCYILQEPEYVYQLGLMDLETDSELMIEIAKVATWVQTFQVSHYYDHFLNHESRPMYCIKFRSEATFIGEIFAKALPESFVTFLYRNAKKVTRSMGRIAVQNDGQWLKMVASDDMVKSFLPIKKLLGLEKITGYDLMAVYWSSKIYTIEKIIEETQEELIHFIFTYESFMANPVEFLKHFIFLKNQRTKVNYVYSDELYEIAANVINEGHSQQNSFFDEMIVDKNIDENPYILGIYELTEKYNKILGYDAWDYQIKQTFRFED